MPWTFFNSSGEAMVTHAESEATQAEMEAETAVAHFVPPDLVKNSPGVAKVWVLWELTGAHGITASYNMTSVSDGGAVGNTDHLWATDFSSANYVISGQAEDDHTVWHSATTLAAGGVTTQIRSANDAVVRDSTEAMLVAFGDQ